MADVEAHSLAPLRIVAMASFSAATSLASAADAVAGKAAFAACASCHQVGPSARSSFGPQLNGILGRRAGTLSDYGYSVAMKNANFIWDGPRLAAFLRDPQQVVPGTKMRFFGVGYSERKIADLVEFLQAMKPNSASQVP